MIRSFVQSLRQEFQGYNAKSFSKVLMAGITVAAVALPLALAFGVSSGADAAAGLITAIIAGVIIGARTGPFGSGTVLVMEALRRQWQDFGLYLATCWIGAWIDDGNYQALSEKLRLAVCDASVSPAG